MKSALALLVLGPSVVTLGAELAGQQDMFLGTKDLHLIQAKPEAPDDNKGKKGNVHGEESRTPLRGTPETRTREPTDDNKGRHKVGDGYHIDDDNKGKGR